MRIAITPVTVDDVLCSEAEVSVAVSSSVALRAVPVDADGNEHPDGTIGVVGDVNQEDIATFLAQVSAAAGQLLEARGF